MSNYAWVILAVGVVALGTTFIAILRDNRVAADLPPPGWEGSDAAQEWDDKAAAASGDFGLQPLRDAAAKWTGSIAALLGILSAVAFVAGPSDLVKDVGGREAEVAGWLILAAAATAATGLMLAIMAGQGDPLWSDDLDGWTYRSLTQKRAQKSITQLRNSRYLVLLSLLLIIVATGIAWMTALTKNDKAVGQNAIVVAAGGATCGTLESHGGSLSLKTNDRSNPIPQDARITLVDACP
jgi:hypothetical protein